MAPGYKFFNISQSKISITVNGSIGDDAANQGWALSDIGYFGFKFSNTSGVHYGWGQINIHGATGGYSIGQGFTFTEAYYNTTPDASITVGDTGAASVPEIDPASAGNGGNYALRRSNNGVFGDGDDVVIPVTPSYAAGVNVVYGTRGLWSIALVWWAGRWFGNTERTSAGGRVVAGRLLGAVLILTAVVLAMREAR
jgi:hypothetical protein